MRIGTDGLRETPQVASLTDQVNDRVNNRVNDGPSMI